MNLKMSAKWRPFCPEGDELICNETMPLFCSFLSWLTRSHNRTLVYVCHNSVFGASMYMCVYMCIYMCIYIYIVPPILELRYKIIYMYVHIYQYICAYMISLPQSLQGMINGAKWCHVGLELRCVGIHIYVCVCVRARACVYTQYHYPSPCRTWSAAHILPARYRSYNSVGRCHQGCDSSSWHRR